MTGYGLIVSEDRDVFEKLRMAVQNDHRFIAADGVVHCDGTAAPLTNIYPIDAAEADWESWVTETPLSNPQSMTTLLFECRSPEWIAEVGRLTTSTTAMT